MPSGTPSVSAQCGDSVPADLSGGNARSYSRSRRSASFGSRRARNAFEGRPPHASEYIALWPAAQTQRTTAFGSVTPQSRAGTKSANSTQLAAASKTLGATRRQRQIFDQNHSEEYVPPIGARYSGAKRAAAWVMAAASSAAVWSFQSHACAARLFRNLG